MPISHLPYAWGAPDITAAIRSTPEDFKVDEELGFPPDGEGQHVLLRIRKRNTNTQWLACQLARMAGVAARDVGFAGLKDRCAVTSQWFSVDLAGKTAPDWSIIDSDNIRILEVARHGRKLRRGNLIGNSFSLLLRNISGDAEILEHRLQKIADKGIPNYFGEQRFGHDGGNLIRAAAMFSGENRVKDRHKKGLYLSAARSLLFNQILARRVSDDTWRKVLPGEVLMLAGSRSFFVADIVSKEIEQRLYSGDILPTAPLWGRGLSAAQDQALALEKETLLEFQSWCDGLESAGLKQERRPLQLLPKNVNWDILPTNSLCLGFFLPAGSYATVVLRELVADESI